MGYLELDLNISDEAKAMHETVKKFAAEVMRPVGIELDKLADPADVPDRAGRGGDRGCRRASQPQGAAEDQSANRITASTARARVENLCHTLRPVHSRHGSWSPQFLIAVALGGGGVRVTVMARAVPAARSPSADDLNALTGATRLA